MNSNPKKTLRMALGGEMDPSALEQRLLSRLVAGSLTVRGAGLLADAQNQRLGADTQRLGINAQRETAQMQDATNRFGIGVGADSQRHQSDNALRGSMYQADAPARNDYAMKYTSKFGTSGGVDTSMVQNILSGNYQRPRFGLRDGGEIRAGNGFMASGFAERADGVKWLSPRDKVDYQANMAGVDADLALKHEQLRQTQANYVPPEIQYARQMNQQRRGLGLRDGGDLRTGMGGNVPGTGKGDKIPAKYEPGEFVVSNDMLDEDPSLLPRLKKLRKEVLARKGMTPEQADAKAIGADGLAGAHKRMATIHALNAYYGKEGDFMSSAVDEDRAAKPAAAQLAVDEDRATAPAPKKELPGMFGESSTARLSSVSPATPPAPKKELPGMFGESSTARLSSVSPATPPPAKKELPGMFDSPRAASILGMTANEPARKELPGMFDSPRAASILGRLSDSRLAQNAGGTQLAPEAEQAARAKGRAAGLLGMTTTNEPPKPAYSQADGRRVDNTLDANVKSALSGYVAAQSMRDPGGPMPAVPQSLRDTGNIYKTVDAHGRTTYSGGVVGAGARFIGNDGNEFTPSGSVEYAKPGERVVMAPGGGAAFTPASTDAKQRLADIGSANARFSAVREQDMAQKAAQWQAYHEQGMAANREIDSNARIRAIALERKNLETHLSSAGLRPDEYTRGAQQLAALDAQTAAERAQYSSGEATRNTNAAHSADAQARTAGTNAEIASRERIEEAKLRQAQPGVDAANALAQQLAAARAQYARTRSPDDLQYLRGLEGKALARYVVGYGGERVDYSSNTKLQNPNSVFDTLTGKIVPAGVR